MKLSNTEYIVKLQQERPQRRQASYGLYCHDCKHYYKCENVLLDGKMPQTCHVAKIVGNMRFRNMLQQHRITPGAYIHTVKIDDDSLDFDVIWEVMLARMDKQSTHR